MSEQLKHECGVALVRLRKPMEYYVQKYGDPQYGLNKLYLLMEKQHNRGQEAAGVGVVNLQAQPGQEYIFRERALGSNAIKEIFQRINHSQAYQGWQQSSVFLGHLRYEAAGSMGLSTVQPMLRRNNWRSRNLLLAGNFSLTNSDELLHYLVDKGQHPRYHSSAFFLLEAVGDQLDREVQHRYDVHKAQGLGGEALNQAITHSVDMRKVLADTCPHWDGAYVIAGVAGTGSAFVVRDPVGIRPCFYYADDEIIVVASERPVLQTVMELDAAQVQELQPGQALLVDVEGGYSLEQIVPRQAELPCSFERIYFSRGSDQDIYQERKRLGMMLVENVLGAVNHDLDNTVFSFIPNTSEVAYYGMLEGLYINLIEYKKEQIRLRGKDITEQELDRILSLRVRSEKVVVKDIKLRTFIAGDVQRNHMATYVYDITYGSIRPKVDSLVVIDDSIVRGTTLKQSIIKILDRLQPKKIVIVSSAPQVRYPDCYGIDMARMDEFIAFRAVVAMLHEAGKEEVLHSVYRKIKEQEHLPAAQMVNHVQEVYTHFPARFISAKIARMLTPADINAEVELVFQTLEGLYEACPRHRGDWYFSGNYPTPGGVRFVCNSYVEWYESRYKLATTSTAGDEQGTKGGDVMSNGYDK